MMEHLGTTPGSASVAGLLMDEDDYVQVIVDKEVMIENGLDVIRASIPAT